MPPEFPEFQLSPPSWGDKLKRAWSNLFYTPEPPATVGHPAPPFLLTDPRSRMLETLETYYRKTIVLKFCATWCIPCQFELKDWTSFHRQYWRENLVIIGVYMDHEGDLLAYARKNKIPYTCCTAANDILWDYGIYPEGKLPHTCIIDPDGIVAWREASYHTGAAYESRFKPLLEPK